MASLSPRDRVAALIALRALFGTGGAHHGLSRADWARAAALASELLVAPALWRALQPVVDEIPPDVAEELHEQFRANALRNARFRDSLAEVVHALNQSGIVPMLLKGAVVLARDPSPVRASRWMADLDLLIDPAELASARGAMIALGYRADTRFPWVEYELPFTGGRTPGPVDIHTGLGGRPVSELITPGEGLAQSVEVSVAGARARVLSPTHETVHNIVHSAVQEHNHASAGLALRQLLALRAIVARDGPRIDWRLIHERMRAQGLRRVLEDQLWLAHRYAGMDLAWSPGFRRRFAELHEGRMLVSFALGWPVNLHKNLRRAFGREYLDFLYRHDGRTAWLAAARARHAVGLMRRDGRAVLRSTLVRTR